MVLWLHACLSPNWSIARKWEDTNCTKAPHTVNYWLIIYVHSLANPGTSQLEGGCSPSCEPSVPSPNLMTQAKGVLNCIALKIVKHNAWQENRHTACLLTLFCYGWTTKCLSHHLLGIPAPPMKHPLSPTGKGCRFCRPMASIILMTSSSVSTPIRCPPL